MNQDIAMTEHQATELAAKIDASASPFYVKRVKPGEGGTVVEIQDQRSGYVMPIQSEGHWQRFLVESGEAGTTDNYQDAAVRMLALVDDQLSSARLRRDELWRQVEEQDALVEDIAKRRGAIEAGLSASDAFRSVRELVHAPTVESPVQLPTDGGQRLTDGGQRSTAKALPVPAGEPKTRAPRVGSGAKVPIPGGVSRKQWVWQQISAEGRITSAELGKRLAEAANCPRPLATKAISGAIFHLIQEGNVRREGYGVYKVVVK